MKRFTLLLGAALLLAACSQSAPNVDELATAVAETSAAMAAVPTETSLPPTAIPPSPTPQSPAISPLNASDIALMHTFGQSETPRSLAFSPDGSMLASAGGNNQDFNVYLWNPANGAPLQTLSGHTGIVWDVAFSPDGSLLASGSSDQTVKVWDVASGALLQSLDFPYQAVSLRFSPDGQTLAIGGGDGSSAVVWLLSLSSWQPYRTLNEYWNIPDIAFSPNGQYIVAGGTSRNVRIWRTSDGDEQALLSHSGQVSSIAISPDGATIATGLCEQSDASHQCQKGAVWLWDLSTGRIVDTLSPSPDFVTSVAYSPDGSLLFAGSRTGILSLYDASNDALLFSVATSDSIQALAVSPDGRSLVIAGNNSLHLWQAP